MSSLLWYKVRKGFLVVCEKNNYFILKPRFIWILSFHFAFLICCFAILRPTFGLLLKGQGQSSNVNHCSFLLFLLEGQKELQEEFKFWWSAQRGFNWQHFNSYKIPQPTYLFCHTILIIAKSSMLRSFNPLPWKYWRSTSPT